MELVDTHCHLSFPPLRERIPQVISRARAAGVGRVVVPSFDPASWPAVAELAELEGIHAAFGVHPWAVDGPLPEAELGARLESGGAVAVGEIGLDGAPGLPPLERQREALEGQLRLAQDLDLPVILHVRGAAREVIDLLKKFSPRLRGVVHAYSRGPELAAEFLALGLHIAFGGAVTRPGARRAQRSAVAVPLGRALLETDAPSIGMEGVAPEETEPQHVARVARRLAELKGLDPDRVAEETTENARALFSIG